MFRSYIPKDTRLRVPPETEVIENMRDVIATDLELDDKVGTPNDTEEQRLGSINANIIHLHSYLTSNDETKAIQAEWKAAARVIGRLFFRLTLVVAVMDTIILFAPQL